MPCCIPAVAQCQYHTHSDRSAPRNQHQACQSLWHISAPSHRCCWCLNQRYHNKLWLSGACATLHATAVHTHAFSHQEHSNFNGSFLSHKPITDPLVLLSHATICASDVSVSALCQAEQRARALLRLDLPETPQYEPGQVLGCPDQTRVTLSFQELGPALHIWLGLWPALCIRLRSSAFLRSSVCMVQRMGDPRSDSTVPPT